MFGYFHKNNLGYLPHYLEGWGGVIVCIAGHGWATAFAKVRGGVGGF